MVVVGKWTVNSKDLIHIHRKAELKSVHALALLCQKSLEFCHQLCFGEGFTFPLLPGWILLELPRQGPHIHSGFSSDTASKGFSSFVPLLCLCFFAFLFVSFFYRICNQRNWDSISALCGFPKILQCRDFFPLLWGTSSLLLKPCSSLRIVHETTLPTLCPATKNLSSWNRMKIHAVQTTIVLCNY